MSLSAKERRELYKREMVDRHETSYNNKDDSGRFRDIFEPGKKLGVKFFKCSEDDHDIYIVPFITGSQHPTLKAGHSDFTVTAFVHRGVGVNEDSYICLNRTYGKKCPICEYQAELRENDDASDAEVKALNPTKRSIFNIVCLDTKKEEDKGVQVWDVSHWLFTVPLEELSHKKKGGGEVLYASPDTGKIISFRKKGSKRNTEFTAFEWKDRDPITDDILDQALCLDELLHIPTYEEVKEAFFEGQKEEAKATEDRDEDTSEKEEKEEVRPKTRLTRGADKEEDVPESVGKAIECPGGAVFGIDYNQYEECQTCEVRRDCRDKLDEIEEKKKQEAPPPPPPERKRLTRREK
jgi:hypothetical protein